MDSIFVQAKHATVSLFPEALQPLASIFLSISSILTVFGLLFAVTTLLERKGLGRMQNRLGPNRVGPWGILQPVADGIKALIKEDVVPDRADKVIHFLAPVVLMVPVLLSFSVLPVGRQMAAIDLDAGLFFFFAVGSTTELAVFMAGWSSRNKYSLLGAMRGVAQMISYELPLVLSTLTVAMLAGTLSLIEIAESQNQYLGILPRWNVFTPWGVCGFMVFFVAANAEMNRSPFDLPEAESELVAGYFTEYSGFKFAVFFMGEYLGMFAMSGLAITLFLGGWSAPLSFLGWIPSWFWFFAKLLTLIAVLIWIRGTLPRMRVDQLMNFAWKFMLPLTLINIPAAALWHYAGQYDSAARWILQWAASGGVLAGAFWALSRLTLPPGLRTKRVYRFAE